MGKRKSELVNKNYIYIWWYELCFVYFLFFFRGGLIIFNNKLIDWVEVYGWIKYLDNKFSYINDIIICNKCLNV